MMNQLVLIKKIIIIGKKNCTRTIKTGTTTVSDEIIIQGTPAIIVQENIVTDAF